MSILVISLFSLFISLSCLFRVKFCFVISLSCLFRVKFCFVISLFALVICLSFLAISISRNAVSEYLEITQSNLSKIENGERNFNLTLLDKICLLYNCSPEYLLGKTDYHEKTTISFRSDEKVDLNVVAKMNEITGFLKLLRKLDGDDK